jgi:hypothetical protein
MQFIEKQVECNRKTRHLEYDSKDGLPGLAMSK